MIDTTVCVRTLAAALKKTWGKSFDKILLGVNYKIRTKICIYIHMYIDEWNPFFALEIELVLLCVATFPMGDVVIAVIGWYLPAFVS